MRERQIEFLAVLGCMALLAVGCLSILVPALSSLDVQAAATAYPAVRWVSPANVYFAPVAATNTAKVTATFPATTDSVEIANDGSVPVYMHFGACTDVDTTGVLDFWLEGGEAKQFRVAVSQMSFKTASSSANVRVIALYY